MREKLAAYMDGELSQRSQLEVQAHLVTCQACRDELDELRRLSHLLHTAPLPEFTPASRFTSKLMLQLPRRDEAPRPRSTASWLGWLVPTALLSAWIFIQVTLGLSSLISLAQKAGWLGQTAAWTTLSPQQAEWFTAVQALFGNLMSQGGLTCLAIVNDAGLFLQNLISHLIWQIVVAILYWVWLAMWWRSRHKQQISKITLQ
jgi:predicted anti-sigma-YlaC factor YlaD